MPLTLRPSRETVGNDSGSFRDRTAGVENGNRWLPATPGPLPVLYSGRPRAYVRERVRPRHLTRVFNATGRGISAWTRERATGRG